MIVMVHWSSPALGGEQEAKRSIMLFYFHHLFPCPSKNGFGWRTAPPDGPKEVSHLYIYVKPMMLKAVCWSYDGDLLAQNASWVLTTRSTCLYNQVSFLFPGKPRKRRIKYKKKRSGAFYSVCRLVHYDVRRRFLGSGWSEEGGGGRRRRRSWQGRIWGEGHFKL